jgi:hypothetical protein
MSIFTASVAMTKVPKNLKSGRKNPGDPGWDRPGWEAPPDITGGA